MLPSVLNYPSEEGGERKGGKERVKYVIHETYQLIISQKARPPVYTYLVTPAYI
jgi:hypothetical protein